jgi:hypothetical protein
MLWDTQHEVNSKFAPKLNDLWGPFGLIKRLADASFALGKEHIDPSAHQHRVLVCARSACAFAALIQHHSGSDQALEGENGKGIYQRFWQAAVFANSCSKVTDESRSLSLEIESALIDLFREFAAISTTRGKGNCITYLIDCNKQLRDEILDSVVDMCVVGASSCESSGNSWSNSECCAFVYKKKAFSDFYVNLQTLFINLRLKKVPESICKAFLSAGMTQVNFGEVRNHEYGTEYIVGDHALIEWNATPLTPPPLPPPPLPSPGSRWSDALSIAKGHSLWHPHFEDVIELVGSNLFVHYYCRFQFECILGESSFFKFSFFPPDTTLGLNTNALGLYTVECQNDEKGHGRGVPYALVYHHHYLHGRSLKQNLLFSSDWRYSYRSEDKTKTPFSPPPLTPPPLPPCFCF